MPAPLITLISEGFGTGDSGKTYPVPVASQIGITNGAASFTDGFPPLTRTALGAGGYPPSGEDMNGILYMATAHLALLCSGQPYKYSSTQATAISGYDVGATLLRSDGTGFWLNLTSGNTSDPDAGGSGWVPGFNYGTTVANTTGGTYNLTTPQICKRVIEVTGALASNIVANFPAGIQGVWIIANNTSNSFSLTAKVAGGTNVVSIPQAGPNAPTIVYSDGTDLWNANVSTAGLAPIASPNFTGTPTAPTAAASSNTTQIATTQMVQAAIAAATASLAPKASPTFSGVPTAPTPAYGDNSAKLATTAFVQAALLSADQSLASNGYVTLPGGVIIQWGVVNSTTSSPETHYTPFPIQFPNACFNVVVTLKQSGPLQSPSTGVASGSVGPDPTRSGFTGTSGGSALGYYWQAIGY